MMYRIGDKVRLNQNCGLDFSKEEAKPDVVYTIENTGWAQKFGDYVRLKGLKAAYKEEWLIPVVIER